MYGLGRHQRYKIVCQLTCVWNRLSDALTLNPAIYERTRCDEVHLNEGFAFTLDAKVNLRKHRAEAP